MFVLIQKYYLLSDHNKHFSHWKNTSLSYASLLITRKIWLHVFAINNNGGSVPVIFISLGWIGCGWGSGWRGNGTCCWGNGICIRSLSHDMLLDVALDLQNLHISFRPPLKYTVNYNTYIYYTHTHKIKWAFCLCIHLQKSMFDYCTYCLASRWT